jgi:hypothetical protein
MADDKHDHHACKSENRGDCNRRTDHRFSAFACPAWRQLASGKSDDGSPEAEIKQREVA